MEWASLASRIVGAKANPKWADIANNIHIPQNDTLDLTLEYDGMNGTAAIKQADVVLLTYPLGYTNQSTTRGIRNLQFYAENQSPDGPAMTYAIFAIDTAQLTTQGCSAYTYLLYSSQPYLRRPFYQFSEQLIDNPNLNGGTNPAFPFLTGHGGYLQVYTHGLTGYRPSYDVLYLDPSLPPQLSEGVFLKGLKFQGGVFDINITLSNTTITRKSDWSFSLTDENIKADDEITVVIGSRNAKSGNYTLKVNGTLTVPTYRADLNTTAFAGNLAQCKPVDSEAPWVPGRFPVSLNDGDNSTVWQPLSNETTVITVDLGEERKFSSAYFLWGTQPPKTVSLGVVGVSASNVTIVSNATYINSTFSNSTISNSTISNSTSFNSTVSNSTSSNSTLNTSLTTQWIVSNVAVNISSPFNVKTFNASNIVFPYGNDSLIALGQSYTSRYVQIAIEGSYDSSGNGGTIAEFVLS
ncbi:alpha,alpha-trehalase ATH1 [Sugiyamaella lignohabitans]|uniref:Alpha,alpha-trehalase ATH1 n=1 Tax=Sugiyamaella lignohabitans TaxID=796027 RepID=A0A167E007_9ASCO|nr:alpha,alpha-trehalase ATH1 [Sugiyamaella lignohabitans]ANB13489.1 alpha,alpha-trehalase ATH1 [Sugiyamaella lignohabitans]